MKMVRFGDKSAGSSSPIISLKRLKRHFSIKMKTKTLSLAFVLFTSLLTAQQKNQEKTSDDIYFLYEKGIVYKYSSDGKKKITANEYFSNGMKIYPDGGYTRLNENMHHLKEGQYLDVNGRVFNNLADLQAQQEAHRIAVRSEFYRLCNGEVVHHRNKQIEKIKNQVNLNHNVTLFPNGSFTVSSGKKYQLKEGQCMDLSGKIFKNTNEYHLECEKKIREGKN